MPLIPKIRAYFSSRMFNKLMLLNFLIILFTFLLILVFVSRMLEKKITEQNIAFSRQVVATVDSWFGLKCRSAKNTLVNLYQDAYAATGAGKTGKDIMELLRSVDPADNTQRMEYQMSAYSYLGGALGKDASMLTLSIVDSARNRNFTSFRLAENPGGRIMNEILYAEAVRNQTAAQASLNPKLRFAPAFDVDASSRLFLLYDVLRDNTRLNVHRGYLAFGFDTEVMRDAYRQYRDLLKGSLLVLTPDGGILHDSTGQRYDGGKMNLSFLPSAREGIYETDQAIYLYKRNDNFDFLTLSILPRSEIKRDAWSANGIAYLLVLLALGAILALSYAGTMHFSKRVNLLIAGIHRIRDGDLSVRTRIEGRDEMQEIAESLNQMCSMLDEHIRKEYVYKLRQKEAELNALQAQINPHFLYNSLEAVRMSALRSGSADVARMVRLLADVFRNSIKGRRIHTIRDELNSCKAFLEFWNIRYEGCLDVIYHIDDDILRFGILRHLVQPLIENALVHGFSAARTDNLIVVNGHRSEGDIRISVRDNGKGIPPARLAQINAQLADLDGFQPGIGMFNVHQRIRLIFGGECGVTVDSVEGVGTEVTLRMHARTMEELENDVQGHVGGRRTDDSGRHEGSDPVG